MDFINTQLCGDGFGGFLIVTGCHYDPETEAMKVIDGVCRGLLDGIGNSDNAGKSAIYRHKHCCLSRFTKVVRSKFRNRSVNVDLCHHGGIPKCHDLAIDHAFHALASHGFEFRCVRKRQPPCQRTLDYCFGQRMFGAPFEGRSHCQQVIFSLVPRGHHVCQLGAPFGECSGLVNDDGIDTRHAFQCFGVFDQNASLCPAARRRCDRNGRRKAQGTGASNDKNGYGCSNSEGERGIGP